MWLLSDYDAQRNLFDMLLNQTEIRLYIPFSDWFQVDLIRFRKYFSACGFRQGNGKIPAFRAATNKWINIYIYKCSYCVRTHIKIHRITNEILFLFPKKQTKNLQRGYKETRIDFRDCNWYAPSSEARLFVCHAEKEICDSFHILRNMIAVTVFLLIMNQTNR